MSIRFFGLIDLKIGRQLPFGPLKTKQKKIREEFKCFYWVTINGVKRERERERERE